MKSIGESGEVMGIYAEIDMYYLLLKEEQKKSAIIKVTPFELFIDKVTGYDTFSYKRSKENIVRIMKNIIQLKKKIEAPYGKDLIFLKRIQKLK